MPCCHSGTKYDGISCKECKEKFPDEYETCQKAWASFNKTLNFWKETSDSDEMKHEFLQELSKEISSKARQRKE